MVESVVKFAFIGVIIVFVVGILGTAIFSWTLDTSPYLQGLTNFLHVIYYVLPMGKLSPIIICFVGLMAFRIVISIIKTLWDLLPISA